MNLILNPVVFFALLAILWLVFILALKLFFKQDKEAEKTLKKALADKEALEKELSLKTQMFEGLKGQYDELEKDFEKLTQAQPPAKPAPQAIKPVPPQPEPQKPETQKPEEQKPQIQQPESQKNEPDTNKS